MAGPNIPAAKRAGLPVDLARLTAEGDGWLAPEDRYSLKTHGVCTQLQDGVFMVRVRIPGGVAPTGQVRGLARVAARHAEDWLHVTTRQNVELHWVRDRDVEGVLASLARHGLSTRSACGHTVRNVMCSEDAGVGLDEPFDCFPDARHVSDALVARSAELNVVLPSRLNVALGGSPRCRHDALVNDAGLISSVVDGVPGYEIWAGGSLGKSPSLGVLLHPFVPRTDVLAAVEALVDVFVAHGRFDEPAKGRMKFVVADLGPDRFRAAWHEAFDAARDRPHPDLPEVEVLPGPDRVEILRHVPPGGWSAGVRPQRTPGLASVTIDLPLGDTCSSEIDLCCDLADRHADGHLTFTRDQNIAFRNVPLAGVAPIRAALAERGVHLLGEGRTAQIRACTGASRVRAGHHRVADRRGPARRQPRAAPQLVAAGVRVGVPELVRPAPDRRHRSRRVEGAGERPHHRRLPGVPGRGSRPARDRRGRRPGRRRRPRRRRHRHRRHLGGVAPPRRVARRARCAGSRAEAFSQQITAALAERWAAGPEPSDTPVLVS